MILVTRWSQEVSISHVCSNVQQFWVSCELWNPSVTLCSIELGLMLLRTAKIHLIYNIFASCETNISKLVKTDTGFCIIRFLKLSPLSPSCISEFSVGQGDPGRNTFSCYIEDKKYFLCAENNEVFLMVSNNLSYVKWQVHSDTHQIWGSHHALRHIHVRSRPPSVRVDHW